MQKSGCEQTRCLERLLTLPPQAIALEDIAEMNLVCAIGLPGSERLDVSECLQTLSGWTAYSRERIEWSVRCFQQDRDHYQLPAEATVNFFRMARLVTLTKLDFKTHYSPDHRSATGIPGKGETLFLDSKLTFLHGLLGDRRVGTCSSIPVLLTALARRLGYPVGLVTNGEHVWCRWAETDAGERFNIEGTNDGGMCSHDDAYYSRYSTPSLRVLGMSTNRYFKVMTARERLAMFLMNRAWILEVCGREREALTAASRACFLAPEDVLYPRHAVRMVMGTMYKMQYGHRFPRACTRHPHGYDVDQFFTAEDGAVAVNILAHLYEATGELVKALDAYQRACEMNPACEDYKTDLVRYRTSLASGGESRALERRVTARRAVAFAIQAEYFPEWVSW